MKNIRLTHFFWFSTVPERLHESLLREYADNGATILSMPNPILESFLAKPDKAVAFRGLLEKTGVSMPDIHAPWGGLWDLCAADTFMRPHLAAGHRLCLEILADFGAKTYTVHIGRGECMTNGGVFSPEMRRRVIETLEAILPTAEKCGIVICVENSFNPAGTPAVLASCLEPFKGSSALGICIDVGHAHIMDPEVPRPEGAPICGPAYDHDVWGGHMRDGMISFADAMDILGPHIVTAHVHDNDGLSDQHVCPGQGNCDFDAIFAALAKCPRLQSVQDETILRNCGLSVTHICRVFDKLMAPLR